LTNDNEFAKLYNQSFIPQLISNGDFCERNFTESRKDVDKIFTTERSATGSRNTPETEIE